MPRFPHHPSLPAYFLLPARSSRALATAILASLVLAGAETSFGGDPPRLPPPPGLEVGAKYHYVFVSSTTRDGTSGDVEDYDAHVQAAADAAGIGAASGTAQDITWRAIVSVGDANASMIHARDHAVVGADVPVYNLRFDLLATGFEDLWDGEIETSIAFDERGDLRLGDAWTGSLADGTADPVEYLGSAAPTAWCGSSTSSSATWLHLFNPSIFSRLHVFALSEELTVEANDESPEFRRGDCNADGRVDVSDALCVLETLFLGGPEPPCVDAGDANDDGILNISDPVVALGVLFLGDPPLPPPGTEGCGPDPTPDELDCVASECI